MTESMLRKTSLHHVTYQVPRTVIGAAGRQDRVGYGVMRITPGLTEPMEIDWGNPDGIPINLVGFTVKIVFWKSDSFGSEKPNLLSYENTSIVLTKILTVEDPYTGTAVTQFSADETSVLGQAGRENSLRWGVFLINAADEVYPAIVTTSGSRFGTVELDWASGIPTADQVLGN